MIYPTIHLNGTSGEVLLEQAINVCQAIRKTLDIIYKAAPNGRDYYLQDKNAFNLASEEYQSRVNCLMSILKEYEDLAEKIADQVE